jgi:UDP-3-O-[3-hydroxymyristoyl] glucosamine N-acyltransferase
MTFTAAQIAMLIDGKVEGDASITVTAFAKIEEAQTGQLCFLSNPKYEDYLYSTSASIVIVNESLELKKSVSCSLIRVKDAYSAFAILLTKYQALQTQQLQGIQQPSFIAPTAKIGSNVFIAAFCYIGDHVVIGDNVKLFSGVVISNNVQLGDHTILHAGVKVYNDCLIGKNVIIHAGTVIGSDGFGFAPLADGSFKKIPQIGNVIIEDYVEIGANSTIDRATMGSTIIKSGSKLDNLIQVGHNAEVGANSVIAAQTGISGSSKLGNNLMIGGQAGIAGHITIADGTKINGQSGVNKSITKPNTTVTGTPAYDYIAALRSQTLSRSLPDMEKRIKALEKTIEKLLSKD